MGHKSSPISLRLGGEIGWKSRWYGKADFAKKLLEDEAIRKLLLETLGKGSAIADIEISRSPDTTKIVIHTGRPGIIIGRGGERLSGLKKILEKKLKGKFVLDVMEIKKPELSAHLVSQNIASQIERRISYRRAAKQALQKVMEAGALGVKILISGRLWGAEIARSEKFTGGHLPLSTLKANIDYGFVPAETSYGTIGVKVWIYLPKQKPEE